MTNHFRFDGKPGDPRRNRLLSLLPIIVLLLAAFALPPAARGNQANLLRATPQRPSAGCSAAQPKTHSSLEVAGLERAVLARVPEARQGNAPLDLVVAFHGRTNSNEQVRRYFDLDEALPNALIVYPRALAGDGGYSWSDPGDRPDSLRDYALFEALVSAFGQRYCIDRSRVFVVGHSLGASFANDVACHRGELVRAVASVAGGLQGGPCTDPTAALLIHHPQDSLVPIEVGSAVRESFLETNDLQAASPHATSEPELAALGCERYGRDAANPVIWCEHDEATTHGGRYYPHTWPDGAADAIARFFRDLR